MSGKRIKAYKASNLTCEEANYDFSIWRKNIPPEFSTPEYKEAKAASQYTIGGSDAGSIMGASAFKDAYVLAAEMLGNIKREVDDETKALFESGHLFEQPVAEALVYDLKKVYGSENVKVRYDKHTYLSRERDKVTKALKYPWAMVNFDCLIDIRDKNTGKWETYLGEIKTTRSYSDKAKMFKSGVCPPDYEWQCRFMMKILDLPGCFISAAWNFDPEGQGRTYIFIERDKEKEDFLFTMCQKFIDCLELGADPEELDNLAKMEEEDKPFVITRKLDDELRELYAVEEQMEALKAQIKGYERRKEELLAQLMPEFYVPGTGYYKFDNGNKLYITSSEKRKRSSIDEKSLKKDFPVIYNSCLEQKFIPASLKKADKDLYERYMQPGEVTGERSWSIKLYENENEQPA